jgi:carboxyl-terminal processing protease
MNNRKSSIAIPLLFSLAVIIGMFIGYKLHSNMPNSKTFMSSPKSNALQEVLQLVKQRYVDKIDIDSTSTEAIQAVLTKLDPHSVYIPISDLMEVNEDLEGQFYGIGVEFNIFNDTVHVLSVVKNGPAQNAGVEIGDKITKVNDSIATGKTMTSDKFKKWVKGPRGSTVQLHLLRENKQIQKTLTRGSIPLTSVDAAYMIDGSKAYLRLNRFSGNTHREFMEAMESLKEQGMQALVLDLRDNGGGILEEAVEIVDEFISGDQLIVYTMGENHPRKEYKAKRPGIFETGKLTILINEGSASASEIIAGALQDLDRATVIGRRSFGKGLVQEQYTLSDGSALRLTTARYYTPLGRSIQKPYDGDEVKYQMEIVNRMHQSKDGKSDTISSGTKSYKTQKGKTLYGGGGITPDQTIAMDPIVFDTTLNNLYEKNTIGDFSYRYFIANRNKINKYKDNKTFNEQFELDDNILDQLNNFAASNGITLSIKNPSTIVFVKRRIKALVARISLGETGYFYVLNNTDQACNAAVASLNN